MRMIDHKREPLPLKQRVQRALGNGMETLLKALAMTVGIVVLCVIVGAALAVGTVLLVWFLAVVFAIIGMLLLFGLLGHLLS